MNSEKRALREARTAARVVGALFARSVASAQRPASAELAPAPRGGGERAAFAPRSGEIEHGGKDSQGRAGRM